MDIEKIYNGRILIIDLDAKESSEEELSEEMVQSSLGGAAVNLELYQQYQDREPIIIGTGPLTASFAPASTGGVITAKSPIHGGIAHVPIAWHIGVEIKLTGFDFLVILGKADEPTRVWIRDEIADIDASSDIWGKSVWETVDFVREEYGDEVIQVLSIGPAGEKGLPAAQIAENYWGGADCFGFGALFGAKNLKTIAFRGMGSIEPGEEIFEKCIALNKEIAAKQQDRGIGALALVKRLGGEAAGGMQDLIQRSQGCFNCPLPCFSFAAHRGDPKEMKSSSVEEPGCLLRSPSFLLAASQLDPEVGMELLEASCKLGVQPTAAAVALAKSGLAKGEAMAKVNELIASNGLPDKSVPHVLGVPAWPGETSPEAAIAQGMGVFSNEIPPRLLAEEDLKETDPAKRTARWLEVQAMGCITGLCPLLLLTVPSVDAGCVAELLNLSLEEESFSADDINNIIKATIKKSCELGAPSGDIHPDLQSDDLQNGLSAVKSQLGI